MKTLDRKFYTRLARNIIVLGDPDGIGRRYLSAVRRVRVLQRGIDEAHYRSVADNPLGQIRFRAPLSVAGSSSPTVVRAEGLVNRGIPVCMSLDDRGRHRGTPIDEVVAQLFIHFGKPFDETEVLRLYSLFMWGHRSQLTTHPQRRYRAIPSLLARAADQMSALEKSLSRYTIEQFDDRRFAVAVDSQDLLRCLDPMDRDVVLGFRGTSLVANQEPCQTLWGVGSGSAVVSASDLRALIGPPGSVVGIECGLSCWYGYVDYDAVVAERHGAARKFSYWEGTA
jgi:hypothetical protein